MKLRAPIALVPACLGVLLLSALLAGAPGKNWYRSERTDAEARCDEYVARTVPGGAKVISSAAKREAQTWTVDGQASGIDASGASVIWAYTCQVHEGDWRLIAMTWADTAGALHAD